MRKRNDETTTSEASDATSAVSPEAAPTTTTAPEPVPAPETDLAPDDGAEVDAANIPVKAPIGDPSRWKNMDNITEAYEIKDRGVLVRTSFSMAYVHGVKLVPDINGGVRIVAG